MKNLIKNNIILAKKFNNTMRYIDDLFTLNNNQFDAAIKDIILYPQELQLKKTTECATALSYLDIHVHVLITIDNGRYSTTFFDEWDSFTFNIMNFPHLISNIPSKPAYGVYTCISQLVHVRIGRICSNFVQFKFRHNTLTQKLMKQGFWYSGLCMAFRKFSRSHVGIITKYGCSVRKHIEEGICLPATDAFLSGNICTGRHLCYMYSTLQIQGIKQTRLRLNKTRLTARFHAFSVAFEHV